MKFDFDKIYDRKGSGCYKYDAMKAVYGRDDLLALWVADMDFAISPKILDTITKRFEHPIFGYNFKQADHFESFKNYVAKRHKWELDSNWLQMSPGIVPAINFMVKIFTEVGDSIVIQQPVYAPFKEAVVAHDRKLLINNLIEKDGVYTIDFEDLEQKISQSKIFIFCSPHNPVGRVWTEEELLKIGRLCKKHNTLIFSDEIHNDLIYPGAKHIPIASLEDFADFTITMMSPAKTYNVAGLQCSAIICPDDNLIEQIKKYLFNIHVYGSNAVGTVAFKAAYEHGEEWLQELLIYLKGNRDYVHNRIAKINGVKMNKSEATYLAWIDFRDLGLTDKELLDFCREKARLALNLGVSFGENGTGFMRLNFGCPRSILVEAMDNLEKAVKELKVDVKR